MVEVAMSRPEPPSCVKKVKQLCGKCGKKKQCWMACAKKNAAALKKAGCHSESEEMVEVAMSRPEPPSCVKKVKQLCGKCGKNKQCWMGCAKKNAAALKKAGCHSESEEMVEVAMSRPEPPSCVKKVKQLCGKC